MNLPATRCPSCKTAFRIADDQLNVQNGWVRCGCCNKVFNAKEHLFEPKPHGHMTSGTPENNELSSLMLPNLPEIQDFQEDVSFSPSRLPAEEASKLPENTALFQTKSNHELEEKLQDPAVQMRQPIEPFFEDFEHSAQPTASDDQIQLMHSSIPTTPHSSLQASTQSQWAQQPPTFYTETKNHPPGLFTQDHQFDHPLATDLNIQENLQSLEPKNTAPSSTQFPTNTTSSVASDSDASDVKLHSPPINIQLQPPPQELSETYSQSYTEVLNHRSTMLPTPSFVKLARLHKDQQWHVFILSLGIASIVLLTLTLFVQSVRAANYYTPYMGEKTERIVRGLCVLARCPLATLRSVKAISIETSSLHDQGGNVMELALLIKNTANQWLVLPKLELELNNAAGLLITRKVFSLSDFSSTQNNFEMLQPLSEQAFKLRFRMNGEKVSGYAIHFFYS